MPSELPAAPAPADVLVISDGKAGHLNQSLGLAEALQRLRPELRVASHPPLRKHELLSPRRSLPGSETPALIIGAGHRTHGTLVALRRRGVSRTVVLMRPSLPRRCFDLCIEPAHDGGRETDRCWLSRGPLNRMRPGASAQDRGLILLGGESPHYRWDNDALLAQVARICDGRQRWTVSDSRRTPPGTLEALAAAGLPGLDVLSLAEQPPGWLADELPAVQRCWITPDSASMVYEALSAGCGVGVFRLDEVAGSRVARGIAQLAGDGLVARMSAADPVPPLSEAATPLAEAERIAGRLLELGWL